MSAPQRIFKVRRRYNKWVADQTLEDFALRYTARQGRHMSIATVGTTALGAASFLALESLAAGITLNYGFLNAVAAMLVVCLLFFITGLPISYYSARHGLDIDLLTRGAGFGYMGSTITSLIYASFTFIFFAIEAAILASALELIFGIPLALGYLFASIAVIPVVTHGITAISKFQVASHKVWLVLQVLALGAVIAHEFHSVSDWASYTPPELGDQGGFSWPLFGAAASVLFALVAQIGEQVDYLRFMPERTAQNKRQWWFWLIVAGPGWVFTGLIKMLLGSFLAFLAVRAGLGLHEAADPAHLYQRAFLYLVNDPDAALILAGVMVVTCQMKINLTNAYAGSIAWSNFFSRVTHSHPGRVVWLVFNVGIALLLMELGIYEALESVLGIFAIVAVSWLGTLAADLSVNKPLGLSPPGIEFKRAHLYDINPVGVGAMLVASTVGFLTYLGVFGQGVSGLSHFFALGTCYVAAPGLAVLTRGRYYIARQSIELIPVVAEPAGTYLGQRLRCVICENQFEREDMSHCTAYAAPICSLCCSLDARCLDSCKPKARLSSQIIDFLSLFLSPRWVRRVNSRLGRFIAMWGLLALLNAVVLSLVHQHLKPADPSQQDVLGQAVFMMYFILLIVSGVVSWLFILAHESRLVAQLESNRQTKKLMFEIEAHKETDRALQDAKDLAERASDAKSRYLSGMSHELRTPLQSILGYAHLLAESPELGARQKEGLRIIQRSGQYLTDLIEGLLDVSKIEAGRLVLNRDLVCLPELIGQLRNIFAMQAQAKGIGFHCQVEGHLPDWVRVDEKRLRQVLINLLSNAVKYTPAGQVSLTVRYRSQVAEFVIQDTGVGIAKQDQERIFQPFERVRSEETMNLPGTGLGLTIVRLLTDIMGGDLQMHSAPGQGSRFVFSVMLPSVLVTPPVPERAGRITGYEGRRRRILVVDDDAQLRGWMHDLLEPLGFELAEAQHGAEALALLGQQDQVQGLPDLALVDVAMPVMDGLTLASRLQTQYPDVLVVMLSAEVQPPESNAGTRAPYKEYLIKPVDTQRLLDVMALHLGLEWTMASPPSVASPALGEGNALPSTGLMVDPESRATLLAALRNSVELGHAKGVMDGLNQALASQVFSVMEHTELVALAKRFQYARMLDMLDAMELQ